MSLIVRQVFLQNNFTKKDTNELGNHEGVVSHSEPDILECEVKWLLGSTAVSKASGCDGIPVELFKTLNNEAIKVLHSIFQQIWKTQQSPQEWKIPNYSVIPIPKKYSTQEVQTTRQLDLSPMLVRSFTKSCMLGFSITWTKNFQASKLVSEKAKEQEIELPTFAGL